MDPPFRQQNPRTSAKTDHAAGERRIPHLGDQDPFPTFQRRRPNCSPTNAPMNPPPPHRQQHARYRNTRTEAARPTKAQQGHGARRCEHHRVHDHAPEPHTKEFHRTRARHRHQPPTTHSIKDRLHHDADQGESRKDPARGNTSPPCQPAKDSRRRQHPESHVRDSKTQPTLGKGNLIRRHRCHSPCPDASSRAGAAHGNHTPPATVQEDPAEFPMQAFSPTSPESQPDGLYPDFQRVPIRAIQQPGPSSWKWRLDPQTAPIPQIGSRLRVVVVSPCG